MANKTEVKKEHIEGILGEKISPEALTSTQFIRDVAVSTNTPGRTTQRFYLIPLPNRCYDSDALDVSGFSQTGANGQAIFRLTSFLCRATQTFILPINVLATPISQQPVFLTVTHVLVNNGGDVEITVFSWDANGAPAPEVAFDWRCRVPIFVLV